jgi:hypothetical protein
MTSVNNYFLIKWVCLWVWLQLQLYNPHHSKFLDPGSLVRDGRRVEGRGGRRERREGGEIRARDSKRGREEGEGEGGKEGGGGYNSEQHAFCRLSMSVISTCGSWNETVRKCMQNRAEPPSLPLTWTGR